MDSLGCLVSLPVPSCTNELKPGIDGILDAISVLQASHGFGELSKGEAAVDERVQVHAAGKEQVASLGHVGRGEVKAAHDADLFIVQPIAIQEEHGSARQAPKEKHLAAGSGTL